jgi:hypothetical protein
VSEQEFLKRLGELYKQYESSKQGNIDAELFKEELYELVLLFKDGDE